MFDVFYRGVGNNYAVACGLEQVVDYVLNLKFDEEDIAYLRSLNIFDEDFLTLLKNFKFNGDIYAVPEGTVIFPARQHVGCRLTACYHSGSRAVYTRVGSLRSAQTEFRDGKDTNQ